MGERTCFVMRLSLEMTCPKNFRRLVWQINDRLWVADCIVAIGTGLNLWSSLTELQASSNSRWLESQRWRFIVKICQRFGHCKDICSLRLCPTCEFNMAQGGWVKRGRYQKKNFTLTLFAALESESPAIPAITTAKTTNSAPALLVTVASMTVWTCNDSF